jgi:CheY-like chemotaxis protein
MGLKPRILIADDNQKILTWVSDLLRPRFEVVAEVTDGRAALEAVAKFNPDLVVLDIAMPELNGIQAARELRRLGSRVKIVFLTVYRDDDYLAAAFQADALGFVYKSRLHTDLIPALDHALAGYRFISPQGFLGQRAENPVTTWFPRGSGFHTMQFYRDEEDRLAGGVDYVIAALKEGATVIYFDSRAHLAGLARKLEVFGLHGAMERGHFVALDVHREVLPNIMVGGMPDAVHLTSLFNHAVMRTSSAGQNDLRLALAGEIAPVLWAEGMPEAALEVERLTDEFVHARFASVLCTYPVEWLYKTRHHQTLARLCALHTSVVPEVS